MRIGTPGTAGQYTRFMVGMFNENDIITTQLGFLAFFGRLATASRTVFTGGAVDIDVIRGNRKIAARILRGGESRQISSRKATKEQQYTAEGRLFPLIEEVGDITSSMLQKRLAGEPINTPLLPIERQRQLGRIEHANHVQRIIRTMAVMATESVLTGQMSAIDATTNTDLIYDFYRNAALTVTAGTAWSNIAAPAMTDIDDMCDLINVHGKVMADGMVLGSTAMDEFLQNTEVLAKADNRRFELILVSDRNPVPEKFQYMIDAGFTARGRLMTARGYELWMFTFLGKYENDAGTTLDFMPAEQVLIFNSMARADRYFGPADRLEPTSLDQQWMAEFFGFGATIGQIPVGAENVITPEMFFFDADRTSNKKASIITQSAPIFVTTQTDAYGIINT